MTGRDDPAEQAAHLAQIILTAQQIVEQYVAEKITVEEAMTALVGIVDAPALTEWLIATGFVSKQRERRQARVGRGKVKKNDDGQTGAGHCRRDCRDHRTRWQ